MNGDKKALEVITGRCDYLQDFVSRYASISQKLALSFGWVELTPMLARVAQMFKKH